MVNNTANMVKDAMAQIKKAKAAGIDDVINQPPKRHHIINDMPAVMPSNGNTTIEKKVSIEPGKEEPRWFNPDLNQSPDNANPSEKITPDQYDAMFYQNKSGDPPEYVKPDIHYTSGEELAKKYMNAAGNADATRDAIVSKNPIASVIGANPLDIHDYNSSSGKAGEGFIPLDELPSKNLFNTDKLAVQPLKLIDMLVIENMDNDNKLDSFSEIYSRRIRGTDPMDILSGDEQYILQYLRGSTFSGDPYTWGGFTCTQCGCQVKDKDYKIDFSNMRFLTNNNPEDVLKLHSEYGYHPITVTGGTLKTYIRRRRHDYTYKAQCDVIKSRGGTLKKPYLALLNMAIVMDIDTCKTLDDRIRFIANLSKDDSILLMRELAACSFKTVTKVAHTCPKCGGITVTPFPFRYSTFISSVQLRQPKKA